LRIVLRALTVVSFAAAALLMNVAPTLAARTHDTIAVTCSNGYTRTVSANAARGVAKALTNFNAHNHKNVACAAAPGAPRSHSMAKQTVSCSNGFEKTVPAKAARAIAKAINAYSTRKNLEVTCTVA
jgi:hypothetical protein